MASHINVHIDNMVLADTAINEQRLGDNLSHQLTMRLNQPGSSPKLSQQSLRLPKLTIDAKQGTSEWLISQQIAEILCKN